MRGSVVVVEEVRGSVVVNTYDVIIAKRGRVSRSRCVAAATAAAVLLLLVSNKVFNTLAILYDAATSVLY